MDVALSCGECFRNYLWVYMPAGPVWSAPRPTSAVQSPQKMAPFTALPSHRAPHLSTQATTEDEIKALENRMQDCRRRFSPCGVRLDAAGIEWIGTWLLCVWQGRRTPGLASAGVDMLLT